MSMRKKTARGPAMPETGRGIDAESQASLSKRIWVIFAVLAGLLLYAGYGMISAQSQLEGVTSALTESQSRIKQAELKLSHALADKDQALADKQEILREISAQGQRIADSSQGEENARAALAAVSSGAETAEKNITARNHEITDLKKRLERAENAKRKADGSVKRLSAQVMSLKSQLGDERAIQEDILGELARLRAAAEPYSQSATPAGRQSQ